MGDINYIIPIPLIDKKSQADKYDFLEQYASNTPECIETCGVDAFHTITDITHTNSGFRRPIICVQIQLLSENLHLGRHRLNKKIISLVGMEYLEQIRMYLWKYTYERRRAK